MVSFSELRDARPSLWQPAADDWATAAKHAANCAIEIRDQGKGPLAQHWEDRLGAVVGNKLATLANWFEAAFDEMRAVVMILDGLAESVELAQSTLQDAISEAQHHQLTILDDGVIYYSGEPTSVPSDTGRAIDQVQELVNQALRAATQADELAATALGRLALSVAVGDPTTAVQVIQVQASQDQMDMLAGDIPTGADAATVAAWWNSLTDKQRQDLELTEPVALAGLNGIPEEVKAMLRGDGKYDRVKLIQFALDHWNDGSIDAFDNNCTMFVSEAMKAAGIREKNNGWGTFDDNNWVEGLQTGWKWLDQKDYSHSASWVQAQKLHDFLVRNGSQEIPLDQVRPGDVIFFEQDSPNPDINQGEIHHAAIVTAVMPDGDIRYTQHTDDLKNLSLTGRALHEVTAEGNQKVIAVRITPHWY